MYIRSAVFSVNESGSCAIGWPPRSRVTIGTSIRTPSPVIEGTADGRDKVDGGGGKYAKLSVNLNLSSSSRLSFFT